MIGRLMVASARSLSAAWPALDGGIFALVANNGSRIGDGWKVNGLNKKEKWH
jgi:hypothetical protein